MNAPTSGLPPTDPAADAERRVVAAHCAAVLAILDELTRPESREQREEVGPTQEPKEKPQPGVAA